MASPYEPRLPPKIPDVAAIPSTQPYGGRGGIATNYGRNPKEPYQPPAQVPFYPYPPHQSGGGIPVMAGQFIPPNGLAGWMQQTPAVQNLYRSRRARPRRRASSRGMQKVSLSSLKKAVKKYARRSSGKKRRASPVRAARVTGRAAQGRLLKGSAAAKRYMAKIRRMRRRR